VGRYLYQWLLINYPDEFVKHISKISEFGRWDDIYLLFPGSLRLSTLDFTNKNYCSSITKETFKKVKVAQQTIVAYIARIFLESFHNFMDGKRGFELFVKWLPSEHSSFNKKYKIVETLCDELDISLKDYRIIYLTPMRKVSDICETHMCKKDWGYINYNKLNKKRIGYYKNAFNRNDTRRFSKWSLAHPSIYIQKPAEIIDKYLNQILDEDKNRESSQLESSWQTTLKLLLDHTSANLITVVDTNGCMYRKNNSTRIFSYALSLSIVSACQRSVDKNKIVLYKNQAGFTTYDLTPSLKDIITTFRLTFTSKPSLKDIYAYTQAIDVKTFLYITYQEYIINKKELEDLPGKEGQTIIIWNIISNEISYKKVATNIVLLSGFTTELYRYFLVSGSFNPECILKEVVDTYSVE
tara:strand:+ start:874 stop:2106 length:1233 start_codon:yes stop_codon:yes gene_type:complete